VDAAHGAAVRIAMTVAQAGMAPGIIRKVVAERSVGGEGVDVELLSREGILFPDLTVGANVQISRNR